MAKFITSKGAFFKPTNKFCKNSDAFTSALTFYLSSLKGLLSQDHSSNYLLNKSKRRHDTQHEDAQNKRLTCDTQHNKTVIMLSAVMLSVACECHYAKCRYGECRSAS